MADSLTDIYNSIKSNFLGVKSAKIDNDIDASLQSIEKFNININSNKFIDSINSLLGKAEDVNTDVLGITKDNFSSSNSVEMYDQSNRIARYAEYDIIVKKISHCGRALNVLTDNIISPDDITKRSIMILEDESKQSDDSDANKRIINRLKEIVDHVDLDKYIKKIVKNTLKKGDNFIEILYSPKAEHALTLLTESASTDLGTYYIDLLSSEKNAPSKNVSVKLDSLKESFEGFQGVLSGLAVQQIGPTSTHQSMSIDNTSASPDTVDQQVFKSKVEPTTSNDLSPEKALKDMFIFIHNPKYIVKLETERFKKCLGYLVFPQISFHGQAGSFAPGQSAVDSLCTKILDKLKSDLSVTNDDIVLDKEFIDAIKTQLNYVRDNKDLRIRYVPPSMMVHWKLDSDAYYPYGESILDNIAFDAKLLMALKTSTTIKKLSHSTDKRIISIETGLPRDAKNLVELVKEGMRKRKISIDSFGSIDSIPSNIATFEDIYIPMRDGKKFVEFDQMQFGQNPTEDIESLKFMRDNIVADMEVPSHFVGLTEGNSNRGLMTVESIMFARTIISYQKELSVYLQELFVKIYDLIYKTKSDLTNIKITFADPKASPYEHEMEYVEQMQRLIEALKTLGVPTSYTKKKYLPNIDWDAIEKLTTLDTMKKELGEESDSTDSSGMGGGMGGMY